jgi:hypothetical protein
MPQKIHYAKNEHRYPVCNSGSVLFGPGNLQRVFDPLSPMIDCLRCIAWIDKNKKDA